MLLVCLISGVFTQNTCLGAKKTDSRIEITDGTASVIKLYNNKTVHGLMFSFTYEGDMPDFVIIAPDGMAYDPKYVGNAFTLEEFEGGVNIKIPSAAIGQWMLQYYTENKMKVDISDYEPEPLFKDFKAELSEDGNMLNWSFSLEHEKKFWFKYNMFISKTGEFDGTQRLILSSDAYSCRMMSGSLLLNEEPGEYSLLIEAEYVLEGKAVKSRASSLSFNYRQGEKLKAPKDFTIEAYKESNELVVGWDGNEFPWADAVRLTVTEDGNCIFRQNLDLSLNSARIYLRECGGEINVSLACVRGDDISPETEKSFAWNPDNEFKITKKDGNRRNDYNWSYSYENASGGKIIEEVAGNKTETVLSGNGERTLGLTGDPCEVKLYYTDSEGIVWVYTENVCQDNVPPEVLLNRDYNDISTDLSRIDISGKTEPGASVSVNGMDVAVKEDGSFIYTLNLSFGENSMTLSATDSAGNVNQIKGKIHMVSSSEYLSDYKNSGIFALLEKYPQTSALVISVVLVTIVLLAIVFFIRKWGRISAYAREELLKHPDYSEGKTLQRIRRARHARMIANMFMWLFIIDVFICGFFYLTGYYVSRLGQYDKNSSLLPEVFSQLYSVSITVDGLFVFANYLVLAGGVLLALTVITKLITSSIRKKADESLITEKNWTKEENKSPKIKEEKPGEEDKSPKINEEKPGEEDKDKR